jgi:WD40 repeat protein
VAFAAGPQGSSLVCPKATALADAVLKPALVNKLTAAVVLLGMVGGGLGIGLAARAVQMAGPSAPSHAAALSHWEADPYTSPASAATEPRPVEEKFGIVAPLPQDNKGPQRLAIWRHHATLAAHQQAARALAFSPDGSRLVSGGDDGYVRVWDVTTRQELLTLREPNSRPVRNVAFSRGGEFLAASTDNGAVLVWDLRSDSRQPPDIVFKAAGRPIHALWVGADCHTVTRGWCDGCVESQVTAGDGPIVLPGQPGVHSVALGNEGRTVAWAVEDGSVKLWDLPERKQRGCFQVHTTRVRCVTFSPEGDRAASADQSPTLKIWDTTTGDELAKVPGHPGPVLALALASGGRQLATRGEDRTVRVWDGQTGEERAVLAGHEKPVYAVAFAPDGRFLASASGDGTTRLWTCTPAAAKSSR